MYTTNITKENPSYCKEIMKYAELRHFGEVWAILLSVTTNILQA